MCGLANSTACLLLDNTMVKSVHLYQHISFILTVKEALASLTVFAFYKS